ncbi:MAG: hypothetical protein LBN05_05020 [Oscillospiraceae bacterium]|jgi:beta-mannosidase|nr:hypothetical protein [Oscillospiraceae bacterium]
MLHLDLSGAWTLNDLVDGSTRAGVLPGCDYTDYWHAGDIPDPYWGDNEYKVDWVARHDKAYSRTFFVSAEQYAAPHADLLLSGVDTLAEIRVNGTLVSKTNNAHRTWRFAVRELLQVGENNIEILLRAPLTFAEAAEQRRHVPALAMAVPGANQLRKPICHFGWDWGPVIPISGVTGELRLAFYSAHIADVYVTQTHKDGVVTLDIHAQHDAGTLTYTLTAPDGEVLYTGEDAHIVVQKPRLWWCNGLGDQPLYTLGTELFEGDEIRDTHTQQIGLRTIELDVSDDEFGGQFQFQINGVPVFARGGNWIVQDSMPGRTDETHLAHQLESARLANMNIIRVWGGGYYESDAFYRLCDEKGLLVWQDFAFACALTPLDEPEYLENCLCEAVDNVKRLRGHASLALLCGNNELAQCASGYLPNKKIFDINMRYFFETLPQQIAKVGVQTPYRGSSPASWQDSPKGALNHKRGDVHIWSIWHGMRPITAYRKMPVRFCSEFGVESFPGTETLRQFSEKKDWSLTSRTMFSHQKCRSGNAKMLYYMLGLFGNPVHFADFCYLSQLTQAQAMRSATEFWRGRFGQCNGSIYWQYNDCWHTASWSGMDYTGRWKALQYAAKRFNAPRAVFAFAAGRRVTLTLCNDLPAPMTGHITWRILSTDKRWTETLGGGKIPVQLDAASARTLPLDIAKLPGGAVLSFKLVVGGACIHRTLLPLQKDKDMPYLPPNITLTSVTERDGHAVFTLAAEHYARFVELHIPGAITPFSDNFFDIPTGESVEIALKIPTGESAQSLAARLEFRSFADVQWQGTSAQNLRQRLKILLSKSTHSFKNYPLLEGELPVE